MLKRGGTFDAELDEIKSRVPEAELTYTFSKSPGPGGQNVNKVNTRVTLLFNLDASYSLTLLEKAQVRARLGSRVAKSGLLRVVAARHRTRSANKRSATKRFYELLAAALHEEKTRLPTDTPPRIRRRRLEEKRRRSQKKRLRTSRVDKNTAD